MVGFQQLMKMLWETHAHGLERGAAPESGLGERGAGPEWLRMHLALADFVPASP